MPFALPEAFDCPLLVVTLFVIVFTRDVYY